MNGETDTTHPDFDDGGAVHWHTDFEEALAEAKRAGKRLFVESGRESCGHCRALVESILPRPEVRDYLNEHFVSLADDCDDMAPQVRELGMRHLATARVLPFVLLTDAEGRWLGGSSGAVTAEGFLRMLRAAVEGPDS